MLFRTEIPIEKSNFLINHQSKTVLLGSCFAQNITQKFNYFKLENTSNPFGIIFNPVAIKNIIERSCTKKYFEKKDIFYFNDTWHCFEVHSELSNSDKTQFLQHLNKSIDSTNTKIKQATHCIITLGTAWVYQCNENQKIVANCHKKPAQEFTKKLLSEQEVETSLVQIISHIQAVNKNVKIVFTVSPVRHIKDGFIENNVSKSRLLSAVYNIVKNTNSATYFPSYEIVIDELRAYRFYKKDMLHPNTIAIDYIWEKFSYSFFNNKTQLILKEIDSIQRMIYHKPFNTATLAYQKFQKKLDNKIINCTRKYPFLQFSTI